MSTSNFVTFLFYLKFFHYHKRYILIFPNKIYNFSLLFVYKFLAVPPCKGSCCYYSPVFGLVWFALLALRCLCFWFRRWFAFALAWVPVPGPVSSKQSTDCPLCPVSTVHRPPSSVRRPHFTSVCFGSVRLTVRWDSRVLYIRKHVHTYIYLCVPAGQQI